MLKSQQVFNIMSGSAAKAISSLLAGSLVLSACGSPVPVPTSYPLTFQSKMQSAEHWQILASDIWDEVQARMEASGYHETAMGLEPPATHTAFTEALNNFLYTEIINHGVAVTPNADFTLTYDIEVVHYSKDRDDPASPGLLTGVAGAGALAGEAYKHNWGVTGAVAAGLPVAAAADFVTGWQPSDSLTELVVNFSVTDQTSVRLRESKIYYIDDGDAKLYEAKGPGDEEDEFAKHLIASNWYADHPEGVKDLGLETAGQFEIAIDAASGPIYDINGATKEAAQRCAADGKQSKFLNQVFPSNDRSQIRATFECI